MKIDFPKEEIATLSKQDIIITHRVSDDFSKFKLNDIVTTPWNEEYQVTSLKVIHSIDESPFKKNLTKYQYEFLKDFSDIAVIRLEKVDNLLNDMTIKAISDSEAKDIIDNFDSYANNERIVLSQLYKYFDEKHSAQEHIWYCAFVEDKCVAMSVLKKIPKGFILLAEIQSIVKGYGKPLIEDILKRSKNIWWCADPHGGEDLINYYRQFDVEEHLIKMSKWTDSPEYAFFKVSDDKHRKQIMNVFDKADKTSEKYNQNKL